MPKLVTPSVFVGFPRARTTCAHTCRRGRQSSNLTDSLGKLPRNVSDHETGAESRVKRDCTALRMRARAAPRCRVRNSCGATVAQEAQFLTGEVGEPTHASRCECTGASGATGARCARVRQRGAELLGLLVQSLHGVASGGRVRRSARTRAVAAKRLSDHAERSRRRQCIAAIEAATIAGLRECTGRRRRTGERRSPDACLAPCSTWCTRTRRTCAPWHRCTFV